MIRISCPQCDHDLTSIVRAEVEKAVALTNAAHAAENGAARRDQTRLIARDLSTLIASHPSLSHSDLNAFIATILRKNLSI